MRLWSVVRSQDFRVYWMPRYPSRNRLWIELRGDGGGGARGFRGRGDTHRGASFRPSDLM